MKKFFLASFILLTMFIASTQAQFFTSQTAQKANEKLAQGDKVGAIAVLDKAIEKRKDLIEAYQMRANLRSATGDFDGAIADFTAVLEINPNNPKIYESRAMFRMFKRDSAGALKDMDAAIANGLKTERAYDHRASIKRDMGDIAGAIADYQTALALNPNLASAHNGMAFTLERSGNIDGAIAHLQEFLSRYESQRNGKLPSAKDKNLLGNPTHTVKREGNESDGSQAYLTSGEVKFEANTPEEVEKKVAQMEQLTNLVHCYSQLGRMYATKNNFDKALEIYERGLQISKNDPSLHKFRSEIRITQGDLQGTIEDLTVIANSPMRMPDYHYDKGSLLILQGKEAEAEQEFALYLQMFPSGRESLNKRIEEVKKLRSQKPQQ